MDCSPSFVIGWSNYFGFGFTPLKWKLLYIILSLLFTVVDDEIC